MGRPISQFIGAYDRSAITVKAPRLVPFTEEREHQYDLS
jgi:hypothetical protein